MCTLSCNRTESAVTTLASIQISLWRRIVFAGMLVALLAVSATAQSDDIPKIRLAAGYANLNFPFNSISVIGQPYASVIPGYGTLHHSGVWVDVEWNPVPW